MQPAEPDWQEVYAMAERFNMPKDPGDRAAEVASWNAEDLIAMTTLTHSVIAPEASPTPIETSMNVSSPDGARKTELMKPEERYGYFQHAAELIRTLGSKVEKGDEQQFLNRAGNIVALATVIAHPFEDGNGRTARVSALLVREGYDKKNDEVRQDIITGGTNRPAEGFRINSFVPRMDEMSPEQYLEAVAAADTPLSDPEGQYKQQADRLFTTPFGN